MLKLIMCLTVILIITGCSSTTQTTIDDLKAKGENWLADPDNQQKIADAIQQAAEQLKK